jgi:hypothetical protein
VCADGANWVPVEVTARNVYFNPSNQLTYAQAEYVVQSAYIYLC